MLPPPAYIVMNQLYEQGIAPSAKTWLYDSSGLADYPDFWQNVKEAGKYMLNFALYHPDMKLPGLMRLKESRRVPLWNGAIECRLFRFDMVAGSNKAAAE